MIKLVFLLFAFLKGLIFNPAVEKSFFAISSAFISYEASAQRQSNATAIGADLSYRGIFQQSGITPINSDFWLKVTDANGLQLTPKSISFDTLANRLPTASTSINNILLMGSTGLVSYTKLDSLADAISFSMNALVSSDTALFLMTDYKAYQAVTDLETWANGEFYPLANPDGYVKLSESDLLYKPLSWFPSWSDVTSKPTFASVATSGDYNDLINLPSIPAAQVNSDWSAASGVSEILNKPTIPTLVSQLTNDAGYINSVPAQSFASLTGKPTTLSGYGITDAYPLSGNPSGFLTENQSITLSGDVDGTGTTAITTTLSNTGVSAGNYNFVTVDLKGRVTAGTNETINDAPGRTLVTTTSSTGFQISATRNAEVSYEGTFQTTTTIGGPASITVFLETSNTNSTTPGDWTIIAQQTNSSTATLAIVINIVDVEPWSLTRTIPAGKYVRIRYGSITGTASASINTQQQEVTK